MLIVESQEELGMLSASSTAMIFPFAAWQPACLAKINPCFFSWMILVLKDLAIFPVLSVELLLTTMISVFPLKSWLKTAFKDLGR